MADIVIRGMKMPANCGECKAFVCYRQWAGDSGDCFCGITKIDAKADARNADCPLIPLPEGHGRLIDADALAARFKKQIVNEDDQIELCKRAGLMGNYFNESKVQIGMISFMRMLNDAETIVPAEGGEADG